MTPTTPKRPATTPADWLLPALLGALALTVYLRTMAPSLLEGDPSEFAVTTTLFGIPHPTGYPLYTLLGNLFVRLPWADVAARLNLMAALSAALVIPLVYVLARQLSITPLGATLAAVVLAFSPSFWATAVMADVYSLNILLIVLSCILLLRWKQRVDRLETGDPRAWRAAVPALAAFAFVYGLSIAHHITGYLLAPAFLVYFVIVGRSFWLHPLRLLLPTAAFMLPLALYLYIPVQGDRILADPLLAQDPAGIGVPLRITLGILSPHYRAGGWSGFTNLIFAGDFADELLNVPWPTALARLSHLPGMLVEQVGLAGLGLALLGLLVQARQRSRKVVLLGLIFVVTAAQITRWDEPDMHIFLIPTYLVLVLWMGVAADRLVSSAQPWLAGRDLAVSKGLAYGALLMLPAGSLAASFDLLDHSQDWAVARYADEVMRGGLPPGAVVLGDWNAVTPLRYRQMIDGQRRDLIILHIGLGSPRFYRIVEDCRLSGRPLYVLQAVPPEELDGKPARFARQVVGLHLPGQVRPQFLAYAEMADHTAATGGLWPRPYLVRRLLRLVEQRSLPRNGVAQATSVRRLANVGVYAGRPHVKTPVTGTPPLSRPSAGLSPAVALLGYDLDRESLPPGDTLRLRFYWQAKQDLRADYRFFVRLITADSRVANQITRGPVSQWFPTSRWSQGDQFSEDVRLPIFANTPPGLYNLEVAWQRGGDTLPILRRDGTLQTTPIMLRQVTIGP